MSQQLFANYWVQKPEVIEIAGDKNIEGTVFVEIDSDRPRFKALAEELYPGRYFSPGAYLCYVGVGTVLTAAKEWTDQPSFLKAFLALNNAQLLDDTLLSKGREIQYELRARILKNGKVKAF